jgi:hypothetical protein
MKYIIMCGGTYKSWGEHRQLQVINGEFIVARTIRLLKENGITDIAISSNDPVFEQFGVPVLRHKNTFGVGGLWIEAFYPTTEPTCYIFGDVVFSKAAIKKIVETETDSIEFFASAPPFSDKYFKSWAEPFAFKVADQERFKRALRNTKELFVLGGFKRHPIAWELWQVIKETPLNEIDYTNYTAINDYTCDCDTEEEYRRLIESGVVE